MEIREYNATSLAYIGDAVMSLYVRELLLAKGYQKPKILQQESVRYVSAKAQASFVKTLKERFGCDVYTMTVPRIGNIRGRKGTAGDLRFPAVPAQRRKPEHLLRELSGCI